MISYLKGKVQRISGQEVTLDVNNVGYLVTCTTNCLASLKPKQASEVIIHTDVQETSIRLFGFVDQLELQVFKLLVSVSGIGAKSAVDILSKMDKVELLRLISQSDSDSLKKIKGVGAKTAERLIVELRDKVSDLVESSRLVLNASGKQSVPQVEEAAQALIALGFNKTEAQQALNRIKDKISKASDTSEIVRTALAGI